jgi:hypothetical protein
LLYSLRKKHGHLTHPSLSRAVDFTNQADQNAANFFDQNYQQYEFPTSSAGASNAVVSSFPFHPHPHPQHPHLGVEALGHAAAASQHTGRAPVPGVNAPEGDGGNHSFNGNGVDHSMDLTMSSTGADTTTASLDQGGQQERSSGKAARTSLSVPGSDESGSKKETPYSRSPDMRNSHKLAERKRRKEMKDLFDELRDQLPVDRGPKTSKWEILSKAVDHIKEICKVRDAFAAELHSLKGGGIVGGEELGQEMTGVEEGGVEAPPPAPEDDNVGSDEYAKYEQQQVTSQQQVEAAAAAANQFNAHHDYSQPTEEEQQQQQQQELDQSEIEYKTNEEYKIQDDQAAHEIVHEQPAEQDWTAIAAQAAEAQQAQ